MPKKKNVTPDEYLAQIAKRLKSLKSPSVHHSYSDNVSSQDKLDTLFAPYKQCQRCPLGSLGRQQVVFGDGNPEATLMFIGEGPGRDEDKQGVPFVGRAGKVLNSIIEAMGLERQDVYISNVVKCRPPKNRVPTEHESNTCTSLLLWHQINIINPKVICTLGASATQAFLGPKAKIGDVRSKLHTLNGIALMPTYHPAYLLRNPAGKPKVLLDMQLVMAGLGHPPKKK